MFNQGMQNQGAVAFAAAAAASPAIDLRQHVNFSFTANTTAAIVVDAVFNIQAAPPSDADPCVPGAFADVPEVVICSLPAQPAAASHFTIPAGTPAGSMCSVYMPCKPDAFVKVLPVSGDTANVQVVAGLHGPRGGA